MGPLSTVLTDSDWCKPTKRMAASPSGGEGETIQSYPMLDPESAPSRMAASTYPKHYNEDEITVHGLLHI